jgi:hypothetical protein
LSLCLAFDYIWRPGRSLETFVSMVDIGAGPSYPVLDIRMES